MSQIWAVRMRVTVLGVVVTSLGKEPARPQAVREHLLAPWFAVGTVCFGAFMGQLDASIVTLAFPALQTEFHAGLAGVQWVSLAYLLVLVAFLVPAGRWSDRSGRKLIYLYGFLIFTAASAACGLAPSLAGLVSLRVVQAIGAAMLQANSVALVVTSVGPARRRAALGVQAAAQGAGLALGPTVGGLLVATVGWRWIFFVNVPVGVLAIVAGWFLLPRTRQRARARGLDPVGAILLAVASTAALIGGSGLAGLRLPGPTVIGVVALAAAAALSFVWWERRAKDPLLDLSMLRARGQLAGFGGAMLAYMVLFGPLVLFPQTLTAAGEGVALAGLVLTALPAGFGLAAIGAERLVPPRWSDRRRCVIGGLIAAVSAGGLAIQASLGITSLLLVLLGVGLGMYIPANNASIMAAVPAQTAATVGGIINMTRGLGTAFGVTAATIALHVAQHGRHPNAGTALTMGLLAACALAAAAIGNVAASGSTHHNSEPGTMSRSANRDALR